jgi:hypothetical protein
MKIYVTDEVAMRLKEHAFNYTLVSMEVLINGEGASKMRGYITGMRLCIGPAGPGHRWEVDIKISDEVVLHG